MATQLYTLENILKEERVILSDVSLGNLSTINWYKHHLHHARTHSQVSEFVLQDAKQQLGHYKEWIAHRNVYTVPNVIKEMRRFEGILRRKLRELNDNSKNSHSESTRKERRSSQRRERRYNPDLTENGNAVREFMEQLCWTYQETVRYAKRSVIAPGHTPTFTALERAVLAIGSMTSCKRDFSHRYGQEKSRAKDLHADEQLVAGALYLALMQNMDVAIVSGDSDIGRLMHSSMDYLSRDNVPGHKATLATLRSRHVRVYYPVEYGLFSRVVDSKGWQRDPWPYVEGLEEEVQKSVWKWLTPSLRRRVQKY